MNLKEEMDAFEQETFPQLANLTPEQVTIEHQIFRPDMDAFEADEAANMAQYRAQLLADIATAEYNLKELCYTSERYPCELDGAIGSFSRGIAFARTRLAEIEKEIAS